MIRMPNTPIQRAGLGPLTLALVVRHAGGMLRLGYLRVAVVAGMLFVPPAVMSVLVERFLDARPDLVPGFGVLLAVVVTAVFRLFGPVVFAGYLDEAVGLEYFKGHRLRFSEVLRKLPWIPLLVADVIVVVGVSVGLALLIVPGLVFYGLFGLVGPVMVQEHRGVRDALGRTFRISRTAVVAIIMLVIVPVAAEQVIHELVFRAAHGGALPVQILLEWLVAAVVGGTVGLLEVALATELMARNPEPPAGPLRSIVQS